MNFVKWHAAPAAHSLHQHPLVNLSNVVDDFLLRTVGSDSPFHAPSVNITESSEAFSIQLAAPGYTKEQFKLRTEKNALTVSVALETGTTNTEHTDPQAVESPKQSLKWLRREFANQGFSRTFRLPDNVNVQAISAGYEAGILTLSLPKKMNDEAWSREITIS